MNTSSSVESSSVSIVVPCHNSGRYVRETLESALRQTLRPLEILVVDDGSTDDSLEIAASFGSAVTIIRQQNQGVSVARNTGLRQAKGAYVLFLDADDLLAPEALREWDRCIRHQPDRAIVMSYASFTEDPKTPPEVWNASTLTGFFPHLIQNCIGYPAAWVFPRKTALEVDGFDPKVRIYQFWHFLCKVALTGVGLGRVDAVGSHYRQLPNSMIHSAPPDRVALGHLHVQSVLCREILASHPDLLEQYGDVLFWSAWTAMHNARACGLPRHEIAELEEAVREIAERGPARVTSAMFPRLIRLFGATGADRIRSLFIRG